MDVEFSIELVHGEGVHPDQHQEHIDRALLGEPETQFETEELNIIECIHEQDAAAVGHYEPDDEIGEDELEISGPVGTGVFFSHLFTPLRTDKHGTRVDTGQLAQE